MLSRLAIIWILFALVIGFFAGGSFVTVFPALQIKQEQSGSAQSGNANSQSIEGRHEATEEAIAYYNKLLTIFTAVLAIATIVLGSATVALYFSAEKQLAVTRETAARQFVEIQNQIDIAREANRAAQKSADAAVATERARFYAVIDHNFLDCINAAESYRNSPSADANPLAASNLPMAQIKLKNYGKTPGILVEVGAGIVLSDKPPDNLVYEEKVVKENIIAANETSELFTQVIQPSQMTLGQAKRVRTGETYIWVYGYASYDDVFGSRQVHRFLQRLIAIGPGFRYVLQSYDHCHYNVSS
jgi:hypothetical protein